MGLFNLLIAGTIVMGAYWFLRSLANAPPAKVAALIRKLGGVALIVVAGLLALRGGYVLAVPLFVAALGIMVYSGFITVEFPWAQKTPGQRSRVTTGLLAMELDHDTGQMHGEILSGPLQGRRASSPADPDFKHRPAYC